MSSDRCSSSCATTVRCRPHAERCQRPVRRERSGPLESRRTTDDVRSDVAYLRLGLHVDGIRDRDAPQGEGATRARRRSRGQLGRVGRDGDAARWDRHAGERRGLIAAATAAHTICTTPIATPARPPSASASTCVPGPRWSFVIPPEDGPRARSITVIAPVIAPAIVHPHVGVPETRPNAGLSARRRSPGGREKPPAAWPGPARDRMQKSTAALRGRRLLPGRRICGRSHATTS